MGSASMGDTATVGISNHAQEQLGDIVFAEVPEAGRQLSKGQEAAVVESVKAASDVYAPVSGEVIEGNQAVDRRSGAGEQRSRRARAGSSSSSSTIRASSTG